MTQPNISQNSSTPLDDDTGLRGGTEGGGLGENVFIEDPVANSSEPTPVTAATRQAQRAGGAGGLGPPEAGNGTTIVSQPGFNEADPAVERKAGRSPGNMTEKSQHVPGDPENPLTQAGKTD